MYAEIEACEGVIVGMKQVLRAIESDAVKKVYLADDADAFVTEKVMEALRGKATIEIEHAGSMAGLGKACNIAVNAAVAALPR